MGIIRGKIFLDREVVPDEATIGGDWPLILCSCGEWKDPKTNVHSVSISLQEMKDMIEKSLESKVICPKKIL